MDWAKRIGNQLEYAVASAQRLFGKDVQIGFNTLKMLINFEVNTSAPLLSARDANFVWVSRLVVWGLTWDTKFSAASQILTSDLY